MFHTHDEYLPAICTILAVACAEQTKRCKSCYEQSGDCHVGKTLGIGIILAVQASDYNQSRYIDVSPTPYNVLERSALEKTQAM